MIFLYFYLLCIWYQAHWSQLPTVFQLADETGRRKTLLILSKAIVYFSYSLTEITAAIQEINSPHYFISWLNIDFHSVFLELVIVTCSISFNKEIFWMYLLMLRSRITCWYWIFLGARLQLKAVAFILLACKATGEQKEMCKHSAYNRTWLQCNYIQSIVNISGCFASDASKPMQIHEVRFFLSLPFHLFTCGLLTIHSIAITLLLIIPAWKSKCTLYFLPNIIAIEQK